MTPAGFPHSDILGSTSARDSPGLNAACHVLHRLLAPRHPPRALCSLTSTQHLTRRPVSGGDRSGSPNSRRRLITPVFPTGSIVSLLPSSIQLLRCTAEAARDRLCRAPSKSAGRWARTRAHGSGGCMARTRSRAPGQSIRLEGGCSQGSGEAGWWRRGDSNS